MEKCWFPLRQTHYPPPATNLGAHGVEQIGAICLGDILKDLQHLDQRLNEGDAFVLPPSTPIYTTRTHGFKWRNDNTRGIGFSGSLSAPVTAAVGLTAGAGLDLALRKSVAAYDEIEFLEVSIIQPRRDFIDKCLESDDISARIKGNRSILGAWKVFMITGIITARGTKSRKAESASLREHSGGPEV